jgi:hypothetical protein
MYVVSSLCVSVSRQYSVRLKGGDRCVIKVLSKNLDGGTEKKHEKRQSGKLVSRPRLEQSSSEVRARNVTAAHTRSIS